MLSVRNNSDSLGDKDRLRTVFLILAPIRGICKGAQTLYSEKVQLNRLEQAPQYNILGYTGNSVCQPALNYWFKTTFGEGVNKE